MAFDDDQVTDLTDLDPPSPSIPTPVSPPTRTISQKDALRRRYKSSSPKAIPRMLAITSPSPSETRETRIVKKDKFPNHYHLTWDDYAETWKGLPRHLQDYCSNICKHIHVLHPSHSL